MGEEDKKSKEAEKPADDEEKKLQVESAKAEQPPPPTLPPQEIVLKVYMHCEGCATKVRRCLKGFEGVEDVKTDYRTSKVVVKGTEKADPLKVLERIKKKISHRQVELISPIPIKLPQQKEEELMIIKSQDNKKEEQLAPRVITVVLGVYMHCEACAQEIKKRIQRMKGVESAEVDLKKSQVTVRGVFEPEALVEYVHKRTGKHAAVVKTETVKEGGGKGTQEGGEQEKKPEEAGEMDRETKKAGENKENGGDGEPPGAEVGSWEVEMKKSESSYYDHSHGWQNHELVVPAAEWGPGAYEYPPHMFSDENPNACTVM